MKSRPKYQWPANRLTPADMAILYHLREKTGVPINQLLQAVVAQSESLCTEEFLKTLTNGRAKKPGEKKKRPKTTATSPTTYHYTPTPKQPILGKHTSYDAPQTDNDSPEMLY